MFLLYRNKIKGAARCSWIGGRQLRVSFIASLFYITTIMAGIVCVVCAGFV